MTDRRNPFDEMDRMIDQMRDAMTRSGSMDMGMGIESGPAGFDFDTPLGRGSVHTMANDANVRMESTDDGFVLVADVPGFETDEIDLRIDGDSLVLVADRDVTEDDESEGIVSRQRRSVRERISIPDGVLESEVSATYRNGVLEVSLPTDVETTHDSRRIDVE